MQRLAVLKLGFKGPLGFLKHNYGVVEGLLFSNTSMKGKFFFIYFNQNNRLQQNECQNRYENPDVLLSQM